MEANGVEQMKVLKVLNNNVIIASHEEYGEVIVTGKGIGFGKKAEDITSENAAEKFFVLRDVQEQEQYKQLINHVDESFIACMNECMVILEEYFQVRLNEHIHVSLTDHLFFAIKRQKQGLSFNNPFLEEAEIAYPAEYKAARKILMHVEECTGSALPEGEIGFVALHIHSALTDKDIHQINKHTQIIGDLKRTIQQNLDIVIDHKDLDHQRLIRHIQQAIDRIENGDSRDEPDSLKKVLKEEYPVCYNLAWKLIKMMQHQLHVTVPESEAVYLTIHLQRLSTK